VLHAAGQVGGKNLHFYINHWPSRGGGQAETEPNRLTVANNVYQSVAKLIKEDRESLVVLMGDFNDHPNDKSQKDVLRAGKGDGYMLTNLMWDMEKNDLGTYAYKGDWGCLDQFLVSPALQDGKGVDVVMESVEIVKKDWMLFVNDKGVASPNRTYGGNNYYGGFSDHLPIYMKISLP
jgi:endonuclease/exonuclease/phosphatase family metal-dependent hydrolase